MSTPTSLERRSRHTTNDYQSVIIGEGGEFSKNDELRLRSVLHPVKWKADDHIYKKRHRRALTVK